MRYKTISSAIVNVSDPALAKQFPTQCTVEPFTDRNVGKATPAHFVKENTVMAGFTSGEKKIDILRQQGKFLICVTRAGAWTHSIQTPSEPSRLYLAT